MSRSHTYQNLTDKSQFSIPMCNEKRIVLYFHLWSSTCLALTIGAIYAALFPPPLPNCSFLCYGFAILCGWQLLPYLEYYLILKSTNSQAKRRILGIRLLVFTLVFVIGGCISMVATFWLFPHPDILERFNSPLPLQLPTFGYLSALYVASFFLYQSYLLIHGRYSAKIEVLAKNQLQRRQLLADWFSEITKDSHEDTLQNANDVASSKIFAINFAFSFLKRLGIMALWMSIPVWIFISIPLRSYSIESLPIVFKTCAIATLFVALVWFLKIVLAIRYQYKINHKGIVWNALSSNGCCWRKLSGVFLMDSTLVLRDLYGKQHQIDMREIELPREFWQTLVVFLPLQLLVISEDGWRYLAKILQGDLQNFTICYQEIWLHEKKEQTQRQGKKKKKKK